MSTPPFRIIALDLDGTLTNSEKIITRRTHDALMRAQALGIRLVLASGRPVHGIRPLAERLELSRHGGFILACNGAAVIDCTSGTNVYRKPLPVAVLPKMVEIAAEEALPLVTYKTDIILATRGGSAYLDEESRINAMPVILTSCFAEEAAAIEGGPAKCLIPGDPDVLVRLEQDLKALFGDRLSISRSASYFLEIMAPGVGKDVALARLLSHLSLRREDLVAFGDGYNDLAMLRFAGVGVAMANAADEVKSAADLVTESNDDDGVGRAVERFLEGGHD